MCMPLCKCCKLTYDKIFRNKIFQNKFSPVTCNEVNIKQNQILGRKTEQVIYFGVRDDQLTEKGMINHLELNAHIHSTSCDQNVMLLIVGQDMLVL